MPPRPRALQALAAAARRRDDAGLRRRLSPRTPDHDGLVDLASNDYLGLARDPRLIRAASRATRRWGTGSTGSRLVTGSTKLHAELEQRLADFASAPAALVFSSGYLANLAAVTVVAGPEALVVSDAGNHASIIDACRLSRARVTVTPHNDPGAVERALAGRQEDVAVVVTDAVFSVHGDRAPLPELHQICRRNGAVLVVDEAHSLGVLGREGRGAVYEAGLADSEDVIRTVTLSKSLGSQGGAVLAASTVVEALIDTGRSFIFDTGLAPACAGAVLAALDVLEAEPERPARVRAHASRLAELATAHALAVEAAEAAVVPVVLGSPDEAVAGARTCTEHGVRVGCFRPPSVPQGNSCLRVTARATLTGTELATADAAFGAVAARWDAARENGAPARG